MKIPVFSDDAIPGKIMEKVISIVRGGEQLPTYDYVDVCIRGDVGWSVKSTKESSPLTWKRAKIPNSAALIAASENNPKLCKELGDLVIEFCNENVRKSMKRFKLKRIGYSRLVMFEDCTAIYFEKEIANINNNEVFNQSDYRWEWSTPKTSEIKEQLNSLHGENIKTGNKAFAWHGKGENQLHFSGEKDWWPTIKAPKKLGDIVFSADNHAIAFKLPKSKVDWEVLVAFLNKQA